MRNIGGLPVRAFIGGFVSMAVLVFASVSLDLAQASWIPALLLAVTATLIRAASIQYGGPVRVQAVMACSAVSVAAILVVAIPVLVVGHSHQVWTALWSYWSPSVVLLLAGAFTCPLLGNIVRVKPSPHRSRS